MLPEKELTICLGGRQEEKEYGKIYYCAGSGDYQFTVYLV